jgi:hypothetical protein
VTPTSKETLNVIPDSCPKDGSTPSVSGLGKFLGDMLEEDQQEDMEVSNCANIFLAEVDGATQMGPGCQVGGRWAQAGQGMGQLGPPSKDPPRSNGSLLLGKPWEAKHPIQFVWQVGPAQTNRRLCPPCYCTHLCLGCIL